jgi:hypothetical protein
MVAIHSITTKNKEGTIIFDEFVDDVQPIKVLEQVWVTVTKVPHALRSFFRLWAVGSIIGDTQKVDMVHLQATDQVRLLVAVFEVKKIPKFADVCIGCNVYRIYFNSDEIAHWDDFNTEEDDFLGDEGGNGNEKDLGDADQQMGEAVPEDNPSADSSLPSSKHPQNLNQKQASLLLEALDLACDKLLNEISIKVMLEPHDGDSKKIYSPLTEEELDSYNALLDSPDKILPSSVFTSPSLGARLVMFHLMLMLCSFVRTSSPEDSKV